MLSKIKQLFCNITVEPINILFLVGILSVEPVRQDFFLQTICRHEFSNSNICRTPTNYNKTVKDATETKTTTYITLWFICYLIFCHVELSITIFLLLLKYA